MAQRASVAPPRRVRTAIPEESLPAIRPDRTAHAPWRRRPACALLPGCRAGCARRLHDRKVMFPTACGRSRLTTVAA
ncbi:Uncharacterised protein [Bordetella pertussis]|nr:Uncharacterised protein [Bordetella pertussis]